MTEEEKLAEEYTKTNALKGLSYRQITQTYDEISGYPYFLEDKIKQAFLAGLEVGRPRWHKVADGDFPNNARTVIIAYYAVDVKTVGTKEVKSLKEIVTEPCFYLDNQGWTDTSDGEPYPYLNKKGVVIAWCEITQYTEE